MNSLVYNEKDKQIKKCNHLSNVTNLLFKYICFAFVILFFPLAICIIKKQLLPLIYVSFAVLLVILLMLENWLLDKAINLKCCRHKFYRFKKLMN